MFACSSDDGRPQQWKVLVAAAGAASVVVLAWQLTRSRPAAGESPSYQQLLRRAFLTPYWVCRSLLPTGSGGEMPEEASSALTSRADRADAEQRQIACGKDAGAAVQEHKAVPNGLNHKPAVAVRSSAALQPEYTAYDVIAKGAPTPTCQDELVQHAKAVNALRDVDKQALQSALQLVCNIFQTDIAAVTLFNPEGDGAGCERFYVAQGTGSDYVGYSPDNISICGWQLLPSSPEVLVVEDMSKDARFCQMPHSDKVLFYVGTPLVSSAGHRIGSLCIAAMEPRRFDASRARMLANIGELIVRQLESRWAAQLGAQSGLPLRRSSAAYRAPYLFVDTSTRRWMVLHVTPAACAVLDLQWEGKPVALWDIFKPPGGIKPSAAYQAVTAASQHAEFCISGVLRPGDPETVTLVFRPASSDAIDKDTQLIGVPSHLRDAPATCHNYFMVGLQHSTPYSPTHSPSAKSPSAPGNAASKPPHASHHRKMQRHSSKVIGAEPLRGRVTRLPDLRLGSMVGRGAYGTVYRADYGGTLVAVKVVHDASRVRRDDKGVPLEVALMGGRQRRGLVTCIAHAESEAVSGDFPSGAGSSWLVMEYCDQGCIREAVVKGWFRNNLSATNDSGVDLRAVLRTGVEICTALEILHSHDIIHGDLTGGNVLLTASTTNAHGFCAKVADFGLERSMDINTRLAMNSYAHVQHLAPEVLAGGAGSKAVDVYAFGVLLWEMYTGQRAYSGMSHMQLLLQVAAGKKPLPVPQGMPPKLADVLVACLSFSPDRRLPFAQILSLLEDIEEVTDQLLV